MRSVLRRCWPVSLLGLAACFSYQATTAETVPQGTQVRVRVSSAAAARMRGAGETHPETVVGTVAGLGADGLRVRVQEAAWGVGSVAEPLAHEVTLTAPDIDLLEVRRLDPWRTAGVAALAGVVGGLWIASRFDAAGGTDDGVAPGGPDNSAHPPRLLIRFPIPLRLP